MKTVTLESFPTKGRYQVVQHLDVGYLRGSKRALQWNVLLNSDDGEQIVSVGLDYIGHLKLGSVWEDQELDAASSFESDIERSVRVDALDFIELARVSDDWRKREFAIHRKGETTEGPRYCLYPNSSGVPVIISSGEVIRSHLGTPPDLAQRSLAFSPDGSNRALIEKVDVSPDGSQVEIELAPHSGLSVNEASWLALCLSQPEGRRALSALAQSVRVPLMKDRLAYPFLPLPWPAGVELQLRGRDCRIEVRKTRQSPAETITAFAVSEILGVLPDTNINNVVVSVVGKPKRPGKRRSGPPSVRKSGSWVDGKTRLDSLSSPGLGFVDVDVSRTENVFETVLSTVTTKKYTRETSSEATQTGGSVVIPVDVSSLGQRGSGRRDESVGKKGRVSDRDEADSDRLFAHFNDTTLPNLFSGATSAILTADDVVFVRPEDVSNRLRILTFGLHGEQFGDRSGFFSGSNALVSQGAVPLFRLNDTFGSGAWMDETQDIRRRAIVGIIEQGDQRLVFIDIDTNPKRSGHAMSIFTMTMPRAVPFGLRQLSRILEFRIKDGPSNRAWPSGDTHSGYFVTALRHHRELGRWSSATSDSASVKMRSYCHSLLNAGARFVQRS